MNTRFAASFSGPRRATAGAALAGAAILAVFSSAAGTDGSSAAGVAGHASWMIPALFALGGLIALVLALAFAYPSAIVVGLGLLGAGFLTGLPAGGPIASTTPFAGGLLLAVAELAYWSVDFRVSGRDDPRIHRRRLAMIGALVTGGMFLSLVPELDFNPGGLDGIELTGLGVIGGGALIATAAALAWRLRSPAHRPSQADSGAAGGAPGGTPDSPGAASPGAPNVPTA